MFQHSLIHLHALLYKYCNKKVFCATSSTCHLNYVFVTILVKVLHCATWFPFNCLLNSITDFFSLFSGLSEEGGCSDAAQTREKEGKEEKECKIAATSPGTASKPVPNTHRYRRPARGHPHPVSTRRNSPTADRETSEDRYQN